MSECKSAPFCNSHPLVVPNLVDTISFLFQPEVKAINANNHRCEKRRLTEIVRVPLNLLRSRARNMCTTI